MCSPSALSEHFISLLLSLKRSNGARGAAGCVVAIILALQVSAQVTDQWRRKSDRGNRYEGTIQIPVSGPALELRSFVATLEPFSSSVELYVRFFLPSDELATVFAQELEDRRHYWMESKPGPWAARQWNKFGPWYTRTVLDVEKVPYGNLGVLVQAGSPADPLLLPAYVYHSSPPRPASVYRLYFRTRSSLRSVVWSLYTADGTKLITHPLPGERLPGETFAIDLSAEGLPRSEMRLEIEATRPATGRERVWDGRLFTPPAP
jgi:hypothetical protein